MIGPSLFDLDSFRLRIQASLAHPMPTKDGSVTGTSTTAPATSTASFPWILVTIGGGLAIAQAIAALLDPPGESFTGSRADYIADALWAAALALTLAGFWNLRHFKTGRTWQVATYGAMAGQAAIAIAVIATLAAGREVLDMLFIAGFGVEIISVLILAVVARSLVLGLLVPALVLSLAFFAQGGAAAFGIVWLVISLRRRP